MGAGAPGAIGRLILELTKLPGIGPKTAERLAHHLIGSDRRDTLSLIQSLQEVVERIHSCRQCFNLTESDLCEICSDARRDATVVCIVEMPRDLAALERAGTYRGMYHVLHGRLDPIKGHGPESLTVDALLRRVREVGVKEIILATNPTLEGDGTALYVSSLLSDSGVKITRLARGVPAGSSLEFANPQMLADALDGRRGF